MAVKYASLRTVVSMDKRAKGCQVGEEPMAIKRTMRMKEIREKRIGGSALGEKGGRRGMDLAVWNGWE